MRERDIEDLIAAFPEEFFPGHSLMLKGRQKSFAGIGRFDLLFTDQYKTNILVELKAVTAKYENATQLAKYKDALETHGERNILMWLVAPNIPSSVREFLDRIGIEYSEIHEVHLRRAAERHGITIESRPDQSPPRTGGSARMIGSWTYRFMGWTKVRPTLKALYHYSCCGMRHESC
jgi:RecB family endonuclease NucS